MLLAGRAVQGIGSGGPQALSGIIHADMFAIRERSRWMSYQHVSWALGTIAGPLIGGAVVQNKDSQWVCIVITIPHVLILIVVEMDLLVYPSIAWK